MLINDKESKVDSNSRVAYIDVYRGIGIFLVLVGHMAFWGKLDHFIHAFHMPMFFFVAGFLYRKKEESLEKVVLHKLRAIIIPYIIWGMVAVLVSFVVSGSDAALRNIKHLFWINNTGMTNNAALWFLTAFFFADIFFYILDRSLSNITKAIVIVVMVIFGSCAKLILPFTLPWSLSASFVGLGFIYSGMLVRKYKEILLSVPKAIYILGTITCLVLTFINGELNMRAESYAIVPIAIINALFFSGILLVISKEVSLRENLVIEYLKKIGQNAIVYLCVHQLIQGALMFLFIEFDINKHLKKIIIFILLMITMYFICEIVSKTKMKVLFGK